MIRTYRSTKEIAMEVRMNLKKELPQWKFSVRYRSFAGGSAIDLSLMSGPEEVLAPWPEGSNGAAWGTPIPTYAQLNQYGFLHNSQASRLLADKNVNNGFLLTNAGWYVMEKATKILAAEHWDDSDIQTDYFSTNFYMHIEIGQWDKPFKVVSR